MTNEYLADQILVDDVTRSTTSGKSLFERFGGRQTLESVHQIFYKKLFKHQWLGAFFVGVNQQHIENQQSDFMAQLTGGPKMYSGRMPHHAHMHIYITEELFRTRSELLQESLIEAGVPAREREEWLKVDTAFKKVMVKQSPTDCKQRYSDEPVFVIPNPSTLAAS
jgi:hemoglobin